MHTHARGDGMDRFAILADKQDCADLVFRLARAVDRCDAALMKELFHADATDDHGMFQGSARDFIAWVIPVLQAMDRTQHIIGQVLIEVDGDTARGESYFIAHHAIPRPDGGVFMLAAGRYLDRFERRDGIWKIAHRHAVYDWNSTAPLSDGWDRAAPGPTRFGTRGPADASYGHFAGT